MTNAILAAEVAEAAARAGGAVLMRVLSDDSDLEIGYKDARANLVTNPALDPVSRMPEFKTCAVRIEPAT